MNSFDDLVGRELAHRKATETEQREMRARADVAAAEGAAAISALLRELAEFLSSRLAPRPVFLEKGPWYGRDKVTPAGWILKYSAGRGARWFQLLLPNGDLWHYDNRTHLAGPTGTANIEAELRTRQYVHVGDYIVAWGQDAFGPSYEKRSDVQDGVWAAWYSYFAQDNPDPPDDARTVLAKLASTIIQSGDNNYRNYR